MSKEEKMDNNNGVYSHKVRAGKRRTYFFDVRATKYDDYFIVLTESKRRFDQDGYEKHKIFLYKEDFNKFMDGLNNVVSHVKNELMPDFDFNAFDHNDDFDSNQTQNNEKAESETTKEDNAEENASFE